MCVGFEMVYNVSVSCYDEECYFVEDKDFNVSKVRLMYEMGKSIMDVEKGVKEMKPMLMMRCMKLAMMFIRNSYDKNKRFSDIVSRKMKEFIDEECVVDSDKEILRGYMIELEDMYYDDFEMEMYDDRYDEGEDNGYEDECYECVDM